MRLKYFVAACLVVGAALYKAGAPLMPLMAGMGLALAVCIVRQRGGNAVR